MICPEHCIAIRSSRCKFTMLTLSKAPPRAPSITSSSLSTSGSSISASPLKFFSPKSSLFSNRRVISNPNNSNPNLNRTAVKADSSSKQRFTTTDSGSVSSSGNSSETVFVGEESVPLEGVIQFEKPNSNAKIEKWGRVALLAGGDVLALLLFAAIGRFSHGYTVWDVETLRTADPFIAGWFLSAYFLGGYSEDGRGMNGLSKAVAAAAKSWALGIPLGIAIRAASSGRIPQIPFILVSLGSTGFLLIGWRALLYSVFPNDKRKKDDVYRRGNPFELFELLTSLVRRW